MASTQFDHTSVLLEESVGALLLSHGDYAIDCTSGGGGHSQLIRDALGPSGTLICLDRDPRAIEHLKLRFAQDIEANKTIVIKSAFSKIKQVASLLGVAGKISGILADLGVSSPQLDDAERGFSFLKDGPLDMRMDPALPETAADIVNTRSERELQLIFQNFGEETYSKRIARKITQERHKKLFESTLQLASCVKSAVPPSHQNKHPATRVFQALRICVNHELDELQKFLEDSFDILKPGGRLAVISFHSLEDRIVKQFFKEKETGKVKDPLLKYLPITDQNEPKAAKIIKPFPLLPSSLEIERNVRSRSAKLRVIEKVAYDKERKKN